mgnify:FL=1
MAKNDNFDDYRLKLIADARKEEEKRLEVNRDLNKELKKQLESEDNIDKVINGVLKTESLREANLQAMIKLKQAETEEERKKAQLELKSISAQASINASIKDQVAGMRATAASARAFLSAILANPIMALAAAALILVKHLVDAGKAVLDTRKELGLSLGVSAKLTAQTEALGVSAKVFGGTVEDIRQAQTAIRNELGLSVQEAANLSFQFAKTAATTGQSEEQLAGTLSIMESISSASREALLAQIETTGEILQQKGLAPGDIFKDVADNAEHFASFAKDGGKNIFLAAGAAKKLGLNMSAVAAATESLLDFETSIEKQMEASLLLGRQINLDRARQLALTGDQEGMLQEILKQVGGEAEFNRLNVLQRRALAESVGQSVENLSRLVRNNTATTTAGVVAGQSDNTEEIQRTQLEIMESSDGYLRTIAKEI